MTIIRRDGLTETPTTAAAAPEELVGAHNADCACRLITLHQVVRDLESQLAMRDRAVASLNEQLMVAQAEIKRLRGRAPSAIGPTTSGDLPRAKPALGLWLVLKVRRASPVLGARRQLRRQRRHLLADGGVIGKWFRAADVRLKHVYGAF